MASFEPSFNDDVRGIAGDVSAVHDGVRFAKDTPAPGGLVVAAPSLAVDNGGHDTGKILCYPLADRDKAIGKLGIGRHSFSAYHRNHTNTTMAVAFTAFAFEDSIDNGGIAHKLGFYRAQSNKVAEKMVRASERQADGRITRSGEILRKKGDLYLVDCAVTGSNPGAADNLKFPLKSLLESKVFPDMEAVVWPGGKFEGHTPLINGDSLSSC